MSKQEPIPFNRPSVVGGEFENIWDAIESGHLSGGGKFTQRCSEWIQSSLQVKRCFLTHSCTAALEMAAHLLEIQPGDEVIMPSYTFTSTANAFVLRGAAPVFVDIRADTLNLNEKLVETAVTSRTKAIVPVHYAGVACEMGELKAISGRLGVPLVEDAAQAMGSTYQGRPLGSIGSIGTLSFHETKNVTSGEGGALLVQDESLIQRAEILCDKGTNRARFLQGEVDKYTWVDVGSSYRPSEMTAAFLLAQLHRTEEVMTSRLLLWNRYHEAFAGIEREGLARRPVVPDGCTHNAHMYYLLLPDSSRRNQLIEHLRSVGIQAVFHYSPLHSSPAGIRCGRSTGELPVTVSVSDRLVRLPMWVGLNGGQDRVIEGVIGAVEDRRTG